MNAGFFVYLNVMSKAEMINNHIYMHKARTHHVVRQENEIKDLSATNSHHCAHVHIYI